MGEGDVVVVALTNDNAVDNNLGKHNTLTLNYLSNK